MADVRALVIKSGTQQQIPAADSLLVGTGIDASAAGALTIGGTTATSITIGSAAITTDFPGPVQLTGDVTTVGGTTFTSDATFEGNVTFGNGPSDTVTFAATTTVIGDIAFNGAGYRVTNMLDPTGPSTQEGATAAWVTAQIAAIPPTAPGAPANSVQFNDGVGGFGGSANLTWDGSILNVTGSGNIFTLTDAIDGVFFETDTTFYTVSLIDPLGSGARVDVSAVNGVIAQGSEIKLTLATAPSTNRLLSFTNDGSQNPTIKSEITTDGGATFSADTLRVSASEVDVGAAGSPIKIVNVADGTNPNDAVNFSQLSALVTGVSSVSATAPLSSSGGATPDISFPSWPANASGALTNDGAGNLSWVPDAGGTVTGTGVDNQIAVWSGTSSIDGSTGLTWDGAAAAFSADGSAVFNESGANRDFRVEAVGNANMLFVDASQASVSIGTTGATHTFNIGAGAASNFAVASGGRIHTYDGSAPTDGQILIGDTAGGNFAKAAISAGTNIAVTNGAGSISIGLTGQVAVGNGGTGQSTLTSGALVVGNGASAVSTLSPGSNGQVLTVVGGAWAAASLPAATDYSVVSITTAVSQGDAVTVAGAAAIATAASTSRVAGIVSATANKVSVLGIVEDCNFEGSLTLAVGDAVYLSASSAGKLTNVAPSSSGEVVAELGIITVVNAAGGGVAAADVLWQPKSIVVL